MVDAKYNVILLRDDQPVRRYRLSIFWLKLLLWIFFLLMLAASAGIYGTLSFWTRFDDLEQRRDQLEKLVQEKNVKLERLDSMAKILSEYEELSSTQPSQADKKSGQKELPRETAPARELDTRPAIDLSKLFANLDLKRVAVRNISLKPLDNKAFQLSLELTNEDGKTLQGQLGLSAITRDAKEFAIDSKSEELVFQINKAKPVTVNVSLPEAIDIGQVFGIKLVVTAVDGKPLFSETYPLTLILPRKAD